MEIQLIKKTSLLILGLIFSAGLSAQSPCYIPSKNGWLTMKPHSSKKNYEVVLQRNIEGKDTLYVESGINKMIIKINYTKRKLSVVVTSIDTNKRKEINIYPINYAIRKKMGGNIEDKYTCSDGNKGIVIVNQQKDYSRARIRIDKEKDGIYEKTYILNNPKK